MFEKDLDMDTLVDDLLAKYPVFGATLNDVKIKFSKKVPTAATDGNTIYVNKEFLRQKPKDEQLFILAHEVCHIALNHIPRAKEKDPVAWNYATDAIINEHLVKDGLKAPEGVIRKSDALNYDAEELYDEVYKAHQKDKQQKQQQSQGNQQKQQGQSGQQQGEQGQQGQNGQQQGQQSQNGQSQQANGQQGAENQQGGQGQSNGQQDNSTPQQNQGGGQPQQGQGGQGGQQGQNGQNQQNGGQDGQNQQQNGGQDGQNQQQNGGQGGGQQGGDNQQQTNQQTSGSGQQGDGGANWEDENGEKSDAESQQNNQQNNQQNSQQNNQQQNNEQQGQNGQNPNQQNQQGNQNQGSNGANNEQQNQQNGQQGGGSGGDKHDAADEHPYSAEDYNDAGMGNNDAQGNSQQNGGGGAGGGQQNDDLMKNPQKGKNGGGSGDQNSDLMPQDEKQQGKDPYGGIFDSENEDMLGHDDHSMWSKVQEKKKENKDTEKDPTDEQQGFNSEKELFEKNDEMKREEAQQIMDRVRSQSRGLGGSTKEFGLGSIGKRDKAVTDWRRLLKSYVEKEEERWGHRFSDSGNNWAARIEDYDIDERAESEIIIDTSGSVSPDLVRAFLRQAKTILKDSDIKIGMFSSDFYGWQEIKKEQDIDELHFYGGGGTNFDAASRAFSKKKTVNHICLTDGEDGGNAGIIEKRSDIIWICYGNPYFKPDNGKVIYVAPEELVKAPEKKNQGRTY